MSSLMIRLFIKFGNVSTAIWMPNGILVVCERGIWDEYECPVYIIYNIIYQPRVTCGASRLSVPATHDSHFVLHKLFFHTNILLPPTRSEKVYKFWATRKSSNWCSVFGSADDAMNARCWLCKLFQKQQNKKWEFSLCGGNEGDEFGTGKNYIRQMLKNGSVRKIDGNGIASSL